MFSKQLSKFKVKGSDFYNHFNNQLYIKLLNKRGFSKTNNNFDFNHLMNENELQRKRLVPELKTFYSHNPVHQENMTILNKLLSKYKDFPSVKYNDLSSIKAIKFITLEDYKNITKMNTRVRKVHYKDLILCMKKLRSIDSQLQSKEVINILENYTNKLDTITNDLKKEKTLDKFGRAFAVGKRKTSVAEVYLVEGDGKILINNQPIQIFFNEEKDVQNVLYPFKVVRQEGKYNVFATVTGGGTTGKSESIMYGIAKALIIHNPLLKSRLRKAGLMTRDTRVVERKKPGKRKSRKSPTWVKR